MSLCQWPRLQQMDVFQRGRFTHSIKSSSLPFCSTISLSRDARFLCINRGHVWSWFFSLPSSSSVVATEPVVFSIVWCDAGCNKDGRIVSAAVDPDGVLCLQVKLEEALTLATDFHNSLQDFINWLTQAEQTLNMVSPASLILETIMFQIDEHKVMFVQVAQPLM